MVYGIDVSSYQGEINWARVASDGITFAHAKATEGVSYRDDHFERNRNGARGYGIHFGGYHFARPDHNQPRHEAFWFYSRGVGKPLPGDLRPVLDLEHGNGPLTLWTGTFLSELEKLTGVRPMLYSGRWFTSAHLNLKALGGYPFWDASYGPNDGREHPAALPNVEHQFTSRAKVFGVIGHVDKNSAPSLAPLLVPGPTPAPKPQPAPGGGTPAPAPEPKNGNPFTRVVWPVPLPAWFWTWAQWKRDGESYQRPWDAPTFVPGWAWVRLKQLNLGGST